MKIISGGQTGVDRAALDAALKHEIPCGGWCPAGRSDEFGRIPARYPVQEFPGGGAAERTQQNVIDSDASVLVHNGNLQGGTEFTLQCCLEHNRPCLMIDASKTPPGEAAKQILEFVRNKKVERLNVAGPRQTEWSEGYGYGFTALDTFLQSLAG